MTIDLLSAADRFATALHVPLYEEARGLRQRQQAHNLVRAMAPPLDAGGLPVVLIGGLLDTPWLLEPLSDWFDLLRCRPTLAPVGFGVDCGERTTVRVLRALEELVHDTGRPALIVAHSRGGQFARAAAVRRPDLVHALITLGSPLTRLLGGAHPLVQAEAVAFGVAGTLGAPGVMRYGCLHGRCCRTLREDLTKPFPPDIPFLSVFSHTDQVVDWRSSLDPGARHRHVPTTHVGLLYAFDVLSEELIRLGMVPAPDAGPPHDERPDSLGGDAVA